MDLILTNKNGQTLDLLNNKNRFILKSAEALHGVDTEIIENELPYTDGSTIDDVKALPRGIELTFKLVGNVKSSIDYFTSIVKSKQWVTLREVENGRDIVIKGIATIPPYSRMQRACELVVSIYCPQPYWEDIDYIVGVIAEKIDLLYFPTEGQYFTPTGRPFGTIDTKLEKTFNNEGDTAVGMLISIIALGEVVNPRISCSTGDQNGFYMKLNITLKDDDEVQINTVKNDKFITINGLETYNGEPILNYLEWYGTDWLQLETGANTFSVTTEGDNSNLYFNIIYKARYE